MNHQQTLYYNYNNLTSLKDIIFPDNLQSLYINNNPIESFVNIEFPESLHDLFLSIHRNTDYSTLQLPSNLVNLDLDSYEDDYVLFILDKVKLPESLQRISIKHMNAIIHNQIWPDKLKELDVFNCIIDIKFLPNFLIELNLQRCFITNIDVIMPDTIEVIILSDNKISDIHNVIWPKELKHLDLSNNQITSIDFIQFPNKLTTLYLDYNDISMLKNCVFPPNLKYLNLRYNHIIDIYNIVWPNKLQDLCIEFTYLSCPNIRTLIERQFREEQIDRKVEFLKVYLEIASTYCDVYYMSHLIFTYLGDNNLIIDNIYER